MLTKTTGKRYTPKEIERILLLTQDAVSLNVMIGGPDGEADTELGDLIPDEGPGPEDLFLIEDRKNNVHKCLNGALRPREAEVLKMRFGIGDYPIMTLEEIGEKLNITRERVRQIESKALRKAKVYFLKQKMRFEDV